jgi:hypothetical protein
LLDHFRSSLDPEWIEEALEATGTATVRRRRLPAEQVVWLVLGMGIYRNKPITEIVAERDLALPGRRGPRAASSSVTQARSRLGDEPIRWLFELTLSLDGAGRIPEHLRRPRADVAHFILPKRRQRPYPRAVKIKMSNHPRKRRGPE